MTILLVLSAAYLFLGVWLAIMWWIMYRAGKAHANFTKDKAWKFTIFIVLAWLPSIIYDALKDLNDWKNH